MTPRISISDAFDGGNIRHLSQEVNNNDSKILDVRLEIKNDIYTELEDKAHSQYFCFRAMVSGQQRVRYIITNAGQCSYPTAWPGMTVFYSSTFTDVDSWKRLRSTKITDDDNHTLWWEYDHNTSSDRIVYFSYFPPFPYERHLQLISTCAANPSVQVESLGQSLEGREIECITMGTGELSCWIIHRQHPGETMAEHFAEGLLHRLLGIDGAACKKEQVARLLTMFTFYIVPNMCPDGSVRGHLRTNAAGANLNREWQTMDSSYEAPSKERSPEVLFVRNRMDVTGVDCFMDIHGDEDLPYNFLSGAEHVPKWSRRLEALHGAFGAAYSRANSDMQTKYGYPPPPTPEAALKYMHTGTSQVSNRFDCLGCTLEMPYKDCLSNSDPENGWNPKRSRQLGASLLDALEYVHPFLRASDDSWIDNLPEEDAYVAPTDNYYDGKLSGNFDNKKIITEKLQYYSKYQKESFP